MIEFIVLSPQSTEGILPVVTEQGGASVTEQDVFVTGQHFFDFCLKNVRRNLLTPLLFVVSV